MITALDLFSLLLLALLVPFLTFFAMFTIGLAKNKNRERYYYAGYYGLIATVATWLVILIAMLVAL